MANDTGDIRSTLNNLIETLKDGEEGFRTAAEQVKDTSLRSQFQTWAGERARFASELQSEVTSIGGEPSTSGSTEGAIHRGWIGLKSAVTGNDDHAVLVEAERGEDSALSNFREALTKDFPGDIRRVIERQYREIQTTHNQVRTLRDSEQSNVGSTAGTTRAY